MEQNKTTSGVLTTEEIKRILIQEREDHQKRMQNDPEYRKLWEKREKDLQKFIFPGDSIED